MVEFRVVGWETHYVVNDAHKHRKNKLCVFQDLVFNENKRNKVRGNARNKRVR